ncbi:MAG: DUF2490 domain-containing protein [Thermoanaerobaculia bacterium]
MPSCATRAFILAGAAALLVAASVFGQARAESPSGGESEVTTQLWANVVLDYPKGDRSLFELDIEPKIQISGGDKWRNIDVSPLVEYYPSRWIDLVGEGTVGRTRQSEGVNTWEATPRLGFRLNILSNLREKVGQPHFAPLRRVRLTTLVRVEYRNFWYSDDTPSSHGWRFRTRVETRVGINREDLSRDRTLYGIADLEFFVPLGEDVRERYASKVRARAGLGYRFSYKWRAEALYIRDSHRETEEDPFATDSNILNLKMKVFF